MVRATTKSDENRRLVLRPQVGTAPLAAFLAVSVARLPTFRFCVFFRPNWRALFDETKFFCAESSQCHRPNVINSRFVARVSLLTEPEFQGRSVGPNSWTWPDLWLTRATNTYIIYTNIFTRTRTPFVARKSKPNPTRPDPTHPASNSTCTCTCCLTSHENNN